MYTFSLLMAGSEDWLDVAEAAAYIGKSKHWVYQNRSRMGIPYRRVGGSIRFNKQELDAWIDGSNGGTHAPMRQKTIPQRITL